MTLPTMLSWIYLAMGLLLIAAAIALIMDIVPRNALYGV